ncbi:helix-turn-helix transcriptional regulator [Adlercreutzia sp. ZJ473]|uniref:helix-turn-helix transcriptional regulator n=1 Tax=Adlercreutzia sp. ZJ473 TaxID=2722822 RepID=UPI001552E20E|nr:helix-turn-helix transcriptional regulator [Adlercreutzia sp. ZJ473]
MCLVGLSFYCAMLRAPFFGTLVTDIAPEPSALRLIYDIMTVCAGVLIVVVAVTTSPALQSGKKARIDKTLFDFSDQAQNAVISNIAARFARPAFARDPLLISALSLAAAIGVAMLSIGSLPKATPTTSYLTGILLLCVGFTALTVGWFRQLTRLSRDQITPIVLAAFVLSHAAGLLDIMPRSIAAAASMVYPIGSLAMLHLCQQRALSKSFATEEGHAKSASGPKPSHENRLLDNIWLFSLGLIFAEVICGAFLRSRGAHGGFNYTPSVNGLSAYAASTAIGVIFLIISRHTKTVSEESLLIGGIGLAGSVLAAVSFTAAPIKVLAPFITGLYSALFVYLMALVALWRPNGDPPSDASAGAFLVLYGMSSGITSTVVPTLLSFQGAMPEKYFAPTGIAAGLTISIGICAALLAMTIIRHDSSSTIPNQTRRNMHNSDVKSSAQNAGARFIERTFGEQDSARINPTTATHPHHDSIDPDLLHKEAMDDIAAAFNLTERESEAASLMARGYTVKRVAEELVVAPGTIQGYSKSIYRKMGIHRKDELIEAVNQVKRRIADTSDQA